MLKSSLTGPVRMPHAPAPLQQGVHNVSPRTMRGSIVPVELSTSPPQPDHVTPLPVGRSSRPHSQSPPPTTADIQNIFQQLEGDTGSFDVPDRRGGIATDVAQEAAEKFRFDIGAVSTMKLPTSPQQSVTALRHTPGETVSILLDHVDWFVREAERCFEAAVGPNDTAAQGGMAAVNSFRKSVSTIELDAASRSPTGSSGSSGRPTNFIPNMRILLNSFKQRVSSVRLSQMLGAQHTMSFSMSGKESTTNVAAALTSMNNNNTSSPSVGSSQGVKILTMGDVGGPPYAPSASPETLRHTRSRVSIYDGGAQPNRIASFAANSNRSHHQMLMSMVQQQDYPLPDGETMSQSVVSQARSAVEYTLSAQKTKDDLGVKTLNQYVLMQDIGRGTSGKVKLAFDTIHNRLVAVKIIRKTKAQLQQQKQLQQQMMQPPPQQQSLSLNGGDQSRTLPHRRTSETDELDNTDNNLQLPQPDGDTLSALSGGGISFPYHMTPEEIAHYSLRREIALMKKLRHKNIVSLFEVIDDPDDNKMYLVMQYVDEGSIGSVKADGECTSQYPPIELALFGRQICAGLEYLHSRHVAHRDIKPENVLRGSNDQVYLADFGIAEVMGQSTSNKGGGDVSDTASVADMGRVLPELGRGTLMFMSPELLRGDKVIDSKAADIWALGVMFYALLIGRVPFLNRDEVRHYALTRGAGSSSELAPPVEVLPVVDSPRMMNFETSTTSLPETAPFGNSAAVEFNSSKRVRSMFSGSGQDSLQPAASAAAAAAAAHNAMCSMPASINLPSVSSGSAIRDCPTAPPDNGSVASLELFDCILHMRWKKLIASMLSVSPASRPTIADVRTIVKEIAKETPPPTPAVAIPQAPPEGINELPSCALSYQQQQALLAAGGGGGGANSGAGGLLAPVFQTGSAQPTEDAEEIAYAITPLCRIGPASPQPQQPESLFQLMDDDGNTTSAGVDVGAIPGGLPSATAAMIRQSMNSTRRMPMPMGSAHSYVLNQLSMMGSAHGAMLPNNFPAQMGSYNGIGSYNGVNGMRLGGASKTKRR